MAQFADPIISHANRASLEDAELLLCVVNAFHGGSRSASSLSEVLECSLNHRQCDQLLEPHIVTLGSSPRSTQTGAGTTQISSDYLSTKTSYHCRGAERTKSASRGRTKTLLPPNKTESERLQELEKEPLLESIRPHEVYCLICEDWVALDRRVRYYPGFWFKHKAGYHVSVSEIELLWTRCVFEDNPAVFQEEICDEQTWPESNRTVRSFSARRHLRKHY